MKGFDLGNECTSGCECLHGVEEWVSGDDLAHDSQSFTQALMGQWPAGLEKVVLQHTLLELLQALSKAGHIRQQG